MSSEGNQNKKAVWQDIVPARQLSRAPAKKHRHTFSIPRLPKIPMFNTTNKKHGAPRRRLLIVIIGLIVIAVALVVIYLSQTTQQKKGQTATSNTHSATKVAGGLVPGTPTYAVLLPAGKTIKDLGGGWVRDQSHPLFVYIDKIGSTQINVSEQPLADDLKTDTEQEVESIAQSYNITEKITVGATVVHIGTFDKGVQRIILSKANLLILITSVDHLTNDQWVSYINSLN